MNTKHILACALSLVLTLGWTSAQATYYEWNFIRDGGIYTNAFVEDDIFDKILDGELDIYVEQSAAFDLDASRISISYNDQSGAGTIVSVVTDSATICDKDNFVGCVETLKSDEMRFQHYFIDLDDVFEMKVDDIVSASLRLDGTGLDFSDSELRVRWDWSDHLGLAHNLLPPATVTVNEPAVLALMLGGLFGLRKRWFAASVRT